MIQSHSGERHHQQKARFDSWLWSNFF